MLNPLAFSREVFSLFRNRRENPVVVYGNPSRGLFMRWLLRAQMLFLLVPVFAGIGWWLNLPSLGEAENRIIRIASFGALPLFLWFNISVMLRAWSAPDKLPELHLSALTPREIVFGMTYWAVKWALVLSAIWLFSEYASRGLRALILQRPIQFNEARAFLVLGLYLTPLVIGSILAIGWWNRFAYSRIGMPLLLVPISWFTSFIFTLIFFGIAIIFLIEPSRIGTVEGLPVWILEVIVLSVLLVFIPLVIWYASLGASHAFLCRVPGSSRTYRSMWEAWRCRRDLTAMTTNPSIPGHGKRRGVWIEGYYMVAINLALLAFGGMIVDAQEEKDMLEMFVYWAVIWGTLAASLLPRSALPGATYWRGIADGGLLVRAGFCWFALLSVIFIYRFWGYSLSPTGVIFLLVLHGVYAVCAGLLAGVMRYLLGLWSRVILLTFLGIGIVLFLYLDPNASFSRRTISVGQMLLWFNGWDLMSAGWTACFALPGLIRVLFLKRVYSGEFPSPDLE